LFRVRNGDGVKIEGSRDGYVYTRNRGKSEKVDGVNGIRNAGGFLDEATSENLTRLLICFPSSAGNGVKERWCRWKVLRKMEKNCLDHRFESMVRFGFDGDARSDERREEKLSK